ncbi:carbohydrate kinase family protein [Fervidobacterium sp.]
MILFVGELLADVITEERFDTAEHFTMKIGGSPGNIARYSSQLGIPTRIISKVGKDPIGKRIINKLITEGVDVRYVKEDSEHGTTLVFVQKTTESPDFFVIRGADRYIELEESEIEQVLEGAKILHFSCWMLTFQNLFNLTIKLIEKALEKGIAVSFDPNCRNKLFGCSKIATDRILQILKYTTYAKPSLDDAEAIFGEVEDLEEMNDFPVEKVKYYIEKFHTYGVRNVVLTAGKHGAFASDGSNFIQIPTHAKKVIDATGAGDGFWAGTYFGLINGYDFFRACELGSKVAGYIVGFVGADVPVSELRDNLKDLIT